MRVSGVVPDNRPWANTWGCRQPYEEGVIIPILQMTSLSPLSQLTERKGLTQGLNLARWSQSNLHGTPGSTPAGLGHPEPQWPPRASLGCMQEASDSWGSWER